jgi:hypothetical protein
MAILVLGKCSANFGRQILGKALQFPGKRLHKSLPECFFTLDTDFVGLGLKADFQSSHESPRSSLRVMHEHFHPIAMLNSQF